MSNTDHASSDVAASEPSLDSTERTKASASTPELRRADVRKTLAEIIGGGEIRSIVALVWHEGSRGNGHLYATDDVADLGVAVAKLIEAMSAAAHEHGAEAPPMMPRSAADAVDIDLLETERVGDELEDAVRREIFAFIDQGPRHFPETFAALDKWSAQRAARGGRK